MNSARGDTLPQDLSIIIPVRNEHESIQETLSEFVRGGVEDAELVIIYDDSDDPTIPVLRKIAPNYGFQFKFAQNHWERGFGRAVVTGLQVASREFVAIMTADGADSPTTLRQMFAKLQEGDADLVVGGRNSATGGKMGGSPVKNFVSSLGGWMLFRLGIIPVRDATNSFLLARRETLLSLEFQSIGFSLGFEARIRAHSGGLSVTEVPTTWRGRSGGNSKFRYRRDLPEYVRWFLYGVARKFSK